MGVEYPGAERGSLKNTGFIESSVFCTSQEDDLRSGLMILFLTIDINSNGKGRSAFQRDTVSLEHSNTSLMYAKVRPS
jgi:hypothetical protein